MPRVARVLVMAAVRVVLPWSICPIVPTFTCGFVRSNFFLAMSNPLQIMNYPVTEPLKGHGRTQAKRYFCPLGLFPEFVSIPHGPFALLEQNSTRTTELTS